MEEKTKALESELRDARDNAELLEFRLLELEQRESRERSPDITRKVEKATVTTEVDIDSQSVKSFGLDSGCDSLSCVDDLLDIQKDFRVSCGPGPGLVRKEARGGESWEILLSLIHCGDII